MTVKGQGHPGLLKGLVPIRVTEYATQADRIIDQQQENEMQGRGTVKMDDLDKLRVTKALFDEGCLESRIRQLYSSSTGQKTFGICQANVNWPSLSIYGRFYEESSHPDYIPWGPVRGADLVKINNRYEADRKRKENLPLKNDERALEPISTEDADQYFRDKAKTATGDGNATKIMAKKDMEGSAKNHKLVAVRSVMDSVLAASTTPKLAELMKHDTAMNGITNVVLDGKGDTADAVVPVFASNLDAFALFAEVVKAGKGAELVQCALTIKDGKGDAVLAALATINNPPAPTPQESDNPPAAEPAPAATVEPTTAPTTGKKNSGRKAGQPA